MTSPRHLVRFVSACLIAAATLAGCNSVKLITVDPGHFHAALVQKTSYPQVEPVVHVYAPGGEYADDLAEHLKRIDGFSKRAADPTNWQEVVYTGPDFLEKMLAEKRGNVVVISGNNRKKTDYILKSVEAGLNVLADKPMAINPAEFEKLKRAFQVAKEKNVLLYDIMTERFEVTTRLQRALSRNADLFGTLDVGNPDDPAITKESVHHFSKTVAGAPLKRPAWFFDVRQQGEGIVDVTTHLVDLIQWEAYPDVVLSPSDVTLNTARRWTTPVSPEQFKKVTGLESYPAYLSQDVRNGELHVSSNAEFVYRLKNVYARVSVIWNFEAPAGAGDTHYSLMRGTKARLIIRQNAEQSFKPKLYIETMVQNPSAAEDAAFEARVKAAVALLQVEFPGVEAARAGNAWVLNAPAKYDIGHEAHFGQVMNNYLEYLKWNRLPEWEVPNMITKYSTIMKAYEMSR